jgi:salicylate hydroxylase
MGAASAQDTRNDLRDDPLDIAILGSGIAGLAAAICLRRAGHTVTIYERTELSNEVGAAMNLPPKAVHLLREWGVTAGDDSAPDRARGTILTGTRRLDATTAEILHPDDFAPFVSYRRADLHGALRDRAEDVGAKTVLGKMAVKLDCETGSFTVVDTARRSGKEVLRKDLVILADGVNSIFVDLVTGSKLPLHETGRSAYRTLIPTEKILSDPLARTLFTTNSTTTTTTSHLLTASNPTTNVTLHATPCNNGTEINLTILHQMLPIERRPSDWDSPATTDQALAALTGFHPSFRALVRCAATLRVHGILHRAPLPRHVRHRAVLIGDAARAGAGGPDAAVVAALEDAAALEALLRDVRREQVGDFPAGLAARLRLWEAVRMEPEMVEGPCEGGDGGGGEAWVGGSGPVLKPGREGFFCPYNAYEAARRALRWVGENGYPEDLMRRLQEERVIWHLGHGEEAGVE